MSPKPTKRTVDARLTPKGPSGPPSERMRRTVRRTGRSIEERKPEREATSSKPEGSAATSRARSSNPSRYTPPTPPATKLPSPWWVPTLMFGLLGLGALVIVLNYTGLLGDVDNTKLIIGLALILGGIVAATQYR